MVKQTKRAMPAPDEAPGRKLSRGRRLAVILICLCAVAAAIGVASFDRLPSVIGDNAEFAILARAVATGHGMRYLNHPDLLASTKYPPGFPLMLAMWIPIFGDSMFVMKAVVLVCYVLMIPAAFLFGRRLVGDHLGMIAALTFALSGNLLPYSHEVLSDVPYALFGLIALVLLADPRGRRRNVLAGMGVCLWAYVTRTAGLSLVAAAAVYLFMTARRKEAYVLAGACAAFTVLWALRNQMVAHEGSRYMSVLLAKNPYNPDLGTVGAADVARRVAINFGAYTGHLLPLAFMPALVGGVSDVASRAAVSVLILGVAAVGGYTVRKRALLANLYIAAYMVVYLLWPEVWRTERFMLAIAPVAAVYLMAGIDRIGRYLGLKRGAVLVVCAALAATNLYSFWKYATRERGYPEGWHNYFTAAAWAKANTSENAVFLCRSTYLFYLASGRRTIQYPFTANADTMRAYLFKNHPDYIVLDDVGFPQTERYLVPVLRGMEGTLETVYVSPEPENIVLRFTPQGGPK